MRATPVIDPCPSCGSDIGRGNPAYCPSCRSPLLGQRTSSPSRPVADPFDDWPGQAPVRSGPLGVHDPATTTAPTATPTRRRGRLLWPLIGLGVVALIGLGPALASNVRDSLTGPQRDTDGTVVAGGTVSAFEIRPGDCFDIPDSAGESVFGANLVPCDEPHLYEAYALYVYPDKAQVPYPGLDAISELAESYCLEEFESFVAALWENSNLDFAYLYPQPDGWLVGDREVLCVLTRIDGEPMQGTMRGTRI